MFRAAGVALLRGGNSVRSATAAAVKDATSAAVKDAPEARKTPTNLSIKQPISAALSEFMGVKEASRQEATSKVWEYIMAHKLQNPDKKREYLPDAKLKKVLPEDVVTFGSVSRLLSQHFPQSAKKAKAPATAKTKKPVVEKVAETFL